MSVPMPPPNIDETEWRPGRKVSAGGLWAAFWLVVVLGLQEFGISLSEPFVAAIGGFCQLAVAYWVKEGR